MTSDPILSGKVAIVFGSGGTIGAAVAQTFAAEGSEVFLSGRSQASVETVARRITSTGGLAHAAAVDTLDDLAVNRYVEGVAKQAGHVDIAIDLAGPVAKEYGNGKMAVDLPIEEFVVPITTMGRSRFITARAAARQMVKQRSGVIIFVTGSPARGHVPGATAIGSAFGAMESLAENLAFELGPTGVRVVTIRTLANVDSRSILDTIDSLATFGITRDQGLAQIAQSNFLKTTASVQDTANAAALVASDRARMLTGTVVNATAGAALD
jgi:3-oxoacyl-[acyl-carrier protein] reductase